MSLPPAAASALSSFFASLSIGLQAARPKASDAASRLAVAKRIGDVMSGQLRLCVGCRPRAGNGGMRGLESEDVEKFDIEDQRRVRLDQLGRAHVCTPVTHAHLVCRLLLEKKK